MSQSQSFVRGREGNAARSSFQTPYPRNKDAGFEEMFGDPRVVNNPYLAPHRTRNFYRNIAHELRDHELRKIGNQLSEGIQTDDDARGKWLRIVRECIDYLGLGNDRAKSGQGAGQRSTDIYAPTLLRLAVYNTSKLHANLFPADGLVECKTFGLTSDEVEDQADRMKEFANYMLTNVMSGYIDDKKQAMFWMVLSGQVFSKVYLDKSKNKPAAPYIRPEDIIINAGASGISDAERVTHRFTLAQRVVEEKFRSGEWKRAYLEDYDLQQDMVRQKIDSKIGVEALNDETNKIHCLDECLSYHSIPGFEGRDQRGRLRLLPYIVTKDKESDNVVGIWSNYNEMDPLARPIQRITQYKYFTGPGPNGLGLAHMVLGLAKAETQLQQQLIRAGELSNAPSLLQANTLKNERTQINIVPGSINQVATFDNDIRNAFMPLPFKEPSEVLLMLKDGISRAMDDLSAAADFKPEEMPPNMTATMMSAIISTSHILEDSIMKGLYDSFSSELVLLFNVFAQWLPYTPYPFQVPGGSHYIMREDFTPNVQIRPTIDPNCSSSMHQMVLGETMLNLASQAPELYNIREIHKFILRCAKVNNIDKVLLPAPEDEEIPRLDFISENARALRDEPIKVYPDQDHDAHELGHDDMIQKLVDMNDESNADKIDSLKAHNYDHRAYKYVAQIQAIMGKELPEDLESMPGDVQNKISIYAAKALMHQQQQDAQINPPPLDPNVVMMEELKVKQQELEVKAQKIQQDTQLEQMKMEAENQQNQLDQQIRIKEIELKERQLQFEEVKLELQQQEMQLRAEVEMAKIAAQKEEMQLNMQTKSYDSTLKYELGQQNEDQAADKADLDAQTKAYDSTLKYEQQSKEGDIVDQSANESIA